MVAEEIVRNERAEQTAVQTVVRYTTIASEEADRGRG